jgi:hypothetical protein
MKLALSWLLYHIGDILSYGVSRYGCGYSLYNKIMLLSSDLDDNGIIWKDVK